MRTIHKYPIFVEDFFTHQMSAKATVIAVMLQRDRPYMWVETFDDDTDHVTRTFHVVGTGNLVPMGAIHRGSWIHDPFVWHLYETPIKERTHD